MSKRNVELNYQVIDAFNRRDLDAFLALNDLDVEFVPALRGVEGGDSFRGHEGVRLWWEDLHSVFHDFRVEVVEVVIVGDVTVSRLCIRGRGTDSNAPIEQTNWQATAWLNGKVIWWRTFRSEAKALEAAGLRE